MGGPASPGNRYSGRAGDRHDLAPISECERPHIVHVSGDFPDPVALDKTKVIQSLVDLTSNEFRHHVVSINRIAPKLDALRFLKKARPQVIPFEYGEALSYEAPPKGLLHARMLERLGDFLADRLDAAPPDLLVGHKLTIEGIVVARAAAKLGIPYALSIQGNTDTKILKLRPDLRPRLRKVYHGAACAFPFAPWTQVAVEAYLGARQGQTLVLPCPTDLDTPLAPIDQGNGLISVFHLRHARNKNLAGITAAFEQLPAPLGADGLTIVGGGTAEELQASQAIASHHPGISFEGMLSRPDLRTRLNSASGFVLPSLRESFGLVFIEALFAGLPIIYPKGAAVDGFFDGLPFAVGVDVRKPRELVEAMAMLLREESKLKAELHAWQRSEHARQFTRPEVARHFSTGLNLALAARTTNGHSAV